MQSSDLAGCTTTQNRKVPPWAREVRRMGTAAAASNDLSRVRDRCRRAHAAARQGDVGTAALCDRWYAQVLTAAEDQPATARAVMFQRAAVLFEVMIDMRTWPTRIRGIR
jgi:hypothetical protein